jgi:hypothetical protein
VGAYLFAFVEDVAGPTSTDVGASRGRRPKLCDGKVLSCGTQGEIFAVKPEMRFFSTDKRLQVLGFHY